MRLAVPCGIGFLLCFGFGRWLAAPNQEGMPSRSAAASLPLNSMERTSGLGLPALSETPATTPQRLVDALKEDDPMKAAAESLAWIEGATLADLQNIAADPEMFPFPLPYSGFERECRQAFYDAFFGRWFELDPAGPLPAIRALQEAWEKRDGRNTHSYELSASAWRVRPDLMLEVEPIDNDSRRLIRGVDLAFQRLGSRDPAKARVLLERLTNPQLRRQAEIAIARGIAEKDSLQAVTLARQMDEGSLYDEALFAAEQIGPGMVRQVILAAEGKLDGHWMLPRLILRDPAVGSDLGLAGKENSRSAVAEEEHMLADRTTPEQRAEILANYATLPAGAREDLAAVLASSWARTEPAQAAKWALQIAQTEERNAPANRAVDQVFLRWTNNQPEAALAWWKALPASPLKDALGTSGSTYLAEAGNLDAALELFRPGPGDKDELATAHMAQFIAARDPAEAAAWLKSLPADVVSRQAAETVVTAWYDRAPDAVARFIEAMPAGMRRDEALTAFTSRASQQSAPDAAQWVETIADQELRQDAATKVYSRWSRMNPAAAHEWLESLSGVDPEWHARFLRRLR